MIKRGDTDQQVPVLRPPDVLVLFLNGLQQLVTKLLLVAEPYPNPDRRPRHQVSFAPSLSETILGA